MLIKLWANKTACDHANTTQAATSVMQSTSPLTGCSAQSQLAQEAFEFINSQEGDDGDMSAIDALNKKMSLFNLVTHKPAGRWHMH